MAFSRHHFPACPPQFWRSQIPALSEGRVPCQPCPPVTRSFQLVQYLHAPLICILLVKARTKILNSRSLFSRGCALFHFPYPLSPLLATLTKIAGCVPTIPNLELATLQSPLYSRSFFSHSRALFCAFLHSPKNQPLFFQAIPHSLRKTWGVW